MGDTAGGADVVNLIRLAMAMEATKRPLKREDVISLVLGGNSTHFKSILEAANIRLARDFGLQLVPLPTVVRTLSTLTVAGRRQANRNGANREANSQKDSQSYALVSILERRPASLVGHASPRSLSTLCIVLSMILVSGGELEEDALNQQFASMFVPPQSKSSIASTAIFPLEDLLTQWKKQKYLASFRRAEEDGTHTIVYIIGPRSHLEFPKEAVIDFIVGLGRIAGRQDLASLSERVALSVRVKKSMIPSPDSIPVDD